MGSVYNPWTGEYEETETPAPSAPAVEPAITPDPLATIGAGTATPVPGVTPEGSQTATATPVQPKLDPLAGNIVARGINATARGLAYPFMHPAGFAAGVTNEVNSALSEVASLGGAADNPVSDWLGNAQIQPGTNEGAHFGIPRFEEAAPYEPGHTQNVADVPVIRMLPFVQTARDIATEEGRQKLWEHPEQVGLDLASLLTPGTKPLTGLANTGAKVVGKVGEVISKTPRGAEFVTRVAESRPAGWTQYLPSKRTPETVAFPQAQRRADQIATKTVTPLREIWDTLDEAQKAEVDTARLTGVRPEDPKLASAYDAWRELEELDRAAKVTAEVPEGTRRTLREQTAAKVRSDVERIESGPLDPTVPPKEVLDAQIDAFHFDEPNPHPQYAKSWGALKRDYRTRLLEQEHNVKLYEIADPNGVVQTYPYSQYQRLNVVNRRADALRRKAEQHRPLEAIHADIDALDASPVKVRKVVDRAEEHADSAVIATYFDAVSDLGVIKRFASEAEARRFVRAENVRRESTPSRWNEGSTAILRREAREARAAREKAAEAEAVREAVWNKEAPGRFRDLLEQQNLAREQAKLRNKYAEGFGPKARANAETMIEEAMGTWLSLEKEMLDAGLDLPVYVPSRSLDSPIAEVAPQTRVTTRTPGSLKETGEVARFGRETDPAIMFDADQRAVALQRTTQEAIAHVYRETGGMPYEQAVQSYKERFHLTDEQAHRMAQARKKSFDLDGSVGKAAPGTLVVDNDIALAADHYFRTEMPSMGKRVAGGLLKAWTYPILWLSPRFHLNNILGGTVMTASKEGPAALFKYGRDAYDLARSGDLDFRVSGGAISAPSYEKMTKRFATKVESGNRLAALWKQLNPKTLADSSKRLNQFFDTFFRSIAYLNRYDKTLGKTGSTIAAREAAWRAASDVLQNWDQFSPIEKSLIQPLVPFVSWQKTVLKSVASQAIDHPLRTHVLATLARDDQERRDLPDRWKDLLALTAKDQGGKQYWLNVGGFNPYGSGGDILTLKGFIGSLSPYIQIPLTGTSYSTYLGGAPLYGGKAVLDSETGIRRRDFSWRQLLGFVPQGQALLQAAGLLDLPIPEEESPKGMLDWLDRYGSKLALGPGLSRDSIEEAKATYAKEASAQAKYEAREAKKAGESAPVPKVEAKVPATTPAPATPEPSGLTYNPWTGEYE